MFNLGAHHGVVALMLAALSREVVAVEALPHNARAAAVNLELNELGERVKLVNAAVADEPGTTRIEVDLVSRLTDSRAGSEPVTAVTIDGLSDEYGAPDLIYMDIEGAERRALAGASRTLSELRPWWVVEVHAGCGLDRYGDSVSGVQAVFGGEGYDLLGTTAPALRKRWIYRSRGSCSSCSRGRSHVRASADPWRIVRSRVRRLGDRLLRCLELLRRQADVRVAAETAREDARSLDGRGTGEVGENDERPDRDPPTPPLAHRIVLGMPDHLDDGENRLPSRRVADGEVPFLDVRPPRRGVLPQRAGSHAGWELTVTRTSNE